MKQAPENWHEIVDQLRSAAEEKNLTQIELEQRTGVLQTNISRIFQKKYVPKISTLLTLAEAIGVEIKVIEKIF